MEGYFKIHFPFKHEGYKEMWLESLWASPVGQFYKLDNIPFYITEFALGDIVSTKEEDGKLIVDKLVEESGNSTIQIVFFIVQEVESTRKTLTELGCSTELSDKPNLIAVNIPKNVDYRNAIVPYLDRGYKKDIFDYQEACISAGHSEQ